MGKQKSYQVWEDILCVSNHQIRIEIVKFIRQNLFTGYDLKIADLQYDTKI